MKLTPARLLAVKNTIFSLFGLSTMRFWAVVVMALDRATGFSPGRAFLPSTPTISIPIP